MAFCNQTRVCGSACSVAVQIERTVSTTASWSLGLGCVSGFLLLDRALAIRVVPPGFPPVLIVTSELLVPSLRFPRLHPTFGEQPPTEFQGNG
jgi:hypothetical protein